MLRVNQQMYMHISF